MTASSWILLLVVATSFSNAAEDGYEPMVAFLCDRPAMYLTMRGWVRDETTGCLKDPPAILAYCQKVFPKLDIRNLVESTQPVTIDKWCNFGQKECRHKSAVTPYRCLAGPFQSDALLVPEGCVFDHIHDSGSCTTLSEWSKTSSKSCFDRQMVQNSFSVLQPCGVDRYQGVEFVCCPSPKSQVVISSTLEAGKTAASAKPKQSVSPTQKSTSRDEKMTSSSKDVLSTIETEGPLHDYLKGESFIRTKKGGTGSSPFNEHESYVKAKNDMEKIHHNKVAKMMKDWSMARQRVQELKTIDPKASDKLNKEVTSRFQKTYEAEEMEAEMEKKQLIELHEQRIQVQLNEKKAVALDRYINAIEDEEPELSDIHNALEHYLKILQKERYHAANKLKRIKASNPSDVDEARVRTIAHLDEIDRQVKKALEMLGQVPKFETKINAMIKKSLDELYSMDNIVYNRKDAKFRTSTATAASTTTTTTTTTTTKPTTDTSYEDYYDNYTSEDDYNYDEDDDDNDKKEKSGSTRRTPARKGEDPKDSDSAEDDDDDDVEKWVASFKFVDVKKPNKTSETETSNEQQMNEKDYMYDDDNSDSSEDGSEEEVKTEPSSETKPTSSSKTTSKATDKPEESADSDDDDEEEEEEEDSSNEAEEEEDDKSKKKIADKEDESSSSDEDDSDEESDDDDDDSKSLTTFNTAPSGTRTTSGFEALKDKLAPGEVHPTGQPKTSATEIQQKVFEKQHESLNKPPKLGGAGVVDDEPNHHHGNPVHFNQDQLHAKQAFIDKSKKEGKEFSSAVPLGLVVGTVTVAVVIVAGVLVMRRRNNLRQHRMIPTEPMPIDLVTSPEENHVMNMQVNGYENPTYKYFEINAQN